jgi:hypothetical protein
VSEEYTHTNLPFLVYTKVTWIGSALKRNGKMSKKSTKKDRVMLDLINGYLRSGNDKKITNQRGLFLDDE